MEVETGSLTVPPILVAFRLGQFSTSMIMEKGYSHQKFQVSKMEVYAEPYFLAISWLFLGLGFPLHKPYS